MYYAWIRIFLCDSGSHFIQECLRKRGGPIYTFRADTAPSVLFLGQRVLTNIVPVPVLEYDTSEAGSSTILVTHILSLAQVTPSCKRLS